MTDRLLTTREAAELLGVGPTSVKRWADEGVLGCVKTAGGHRRFPESDVHRFLNEQPRSTDAPTRLDPWIEVLLSSPTPHVVEARLLEERGRLGSWWRVADRVGELVVEIGLMWQEGELSVIEEHIASERLYRGIARVADGIPQAPTSDVCLMVSVDGDEHTLGLALVELCLREVGLRTTWAGRGTPLDEVIELVESGTIQMVAVSASSFSSERRALRRYVQKLGAACVESDVELLLGGSGSWPEPTPYGLRIRGFEALHEVLTQGRRKR